MQLYVLYHGQNAPCQHDVSHHLFSNPIHLIKTTLTKESSKLSSGCIMHNKSPMIHQKCLFHSFFMDIALGQTPPPLT